MSKPPWSTPRPDDDRWRRLSDEIERRDSKASRYLLYLGWFRLRGQTLLLSLTALALVVIVLAGWAILTFISLQHSQAQVAVLAQTAAASALQADSPAVSRAETDMALTPTVAALQTQIAMIGATTTALAAPVATATPTALPTPVPDFKARVVSDAIKVFLDPVTTRSTQTAEEYLPSKNGDVVLCHKYSTRYQIVVSGDCNHPSGWMEEAALDLMSTPFPTELTIPEP